MSVAERYVYVTKVFTGSSADETRRLYSSLEEKGPAGRIAMNLMRAHKNSARAKLYRGGLPGQGSFRAMAYERKRWSMDQLVKSLVADDCGLIWGWRDDKENSPHFPFVLFVELPTGQVSLHTDSRGKGPDFPHAWDGIRKVGVERLCKFAVMVLEGDFHGRQNDRGRVARDGASAPQIDERGSGSVVDGRVSGGSLSAPATLDLHRDEQRLAGGGEHGGPLREECAPDRNADNSHRGAPETASSNVVKLRRPEFDQLVNGWGSDGLDDLSARIQLTSEFWKDHGRGSPAEDKIFAAMVKRKIVLEEAVGKVP